MPRPGRSLAASMVLVGIGTVVFALGVGPALEAGFWALRRSGLAVPVPGASPLPVPPVV